MSASLHTEPPARFPEPLPTQHLFQSAHARYYPMCEFAQLDELAAAFASYSTLVHAREGLPMAWSFWPEPDHTLQSTGAVSHRR